MRQPTAAIAISLTLALGLWFGIGASASAPRRPTSPAKAQVQVVKPATAHLGTTVADINSDVGRTSQGLNQANAGDDESENGNESENEDANETGGHEDPDGVDVNHECPPDCDTENGDTP